MKKLVIEGCKELKGTINISGAKNSVVALIPAATLTKGKCIIKNVPNISDVNLLIEMMKTLGSKVEFIGDTLYIDNENLHNSEIDETYASKMRASYYFMGTLLSRFGLSKVSYPGGCTIGARPINYHVAGFEKLGATVNIENDTIYEITANELKGTTIIHNAAKEPEIENVAEFLISMGANITGVGTDTIKVVGVEELHDGCITVIPDRIEAGTYIMIGSLLGNNLKINGIIKEHLTSVISKLQEAGCNLELNDNHITINKVNHLKPVNIKTLVYPGFVTDLGQPMSTFLTQCEGTSIFEETIYENRMRHIKYLNQMGANIDLDDKVAIIHGKTKLTGTTVEATDLRAGAAMMLAGMIAEGTTTITNIEHILRGYENIVEKLSNVGASIKIVEE